MPSYIVTLKDHVTDAEVTAIKKDAVENGGKITHEYTLIKGFAVEYPEDRVSTLESHPHVQAVERDQEMKTQ